MKYVQSSTHSCRSFGALAHLLKASLCSGVLAMPLAFKNSGLLIGVIGTIIVGLICVHATHIFVKTSQTLCVDIKKPSLGYADTCYLVFKNGPKSVQKFASIARLLADWTLAFTHLGSCCSYVVLVAESLKQVSDVYGGPAWPVTAFCALTLVIWIPLTQITKLKYLVPFSAVANFALLSSICISIYYCLRNAPSLSERTLYTPISGVVNFISTSLFAMEGMGVVMPIENEMTKPHQFLGCPGVLTISMSIVVALFTFIGFTGYMSFGEDVRGSLTLNLPQDEISEFSCNISREDVTQYVPAEHRPQESNTSSFGALAHLLKASLSSGVLAMPLAFKNSGLLIGVIGTIIVGLICVHATHIFVKTSQTLCVDIKRPSLGYADTCYLVFKNGPKSIQKFASIARLLADWALAVTHLGACCVYVVVVAESFKQVSDVYGGPAWSVTVFCALTLVVLIPITQITKLKYLVPFSALANLVWLSSICISIYYCLGNAPSLSKRNLYTPVSGVVNFISTSLFAMEGMGVVMPIENEMTKPHQFLGCPGVLTISMSIVVALFTFIGFTGYMSFGEDVRGSITLNLPQDEILAQIAKILVACVMILSFALIYYVPFDIFWGKIKNIVPEKNQRTYIAGIRLVGTLLTVGLACAIPKLELFMELVGAVCLSILGITLPVIIETVFRWEKDMGKWRWVLWKNLLILIFSILALVSGATCSIKTMLEKL